MMGVKLKVSGDVIFNSAFDGINGFTRGNTGAISDAKKCGYLQLGPVGATTCSARHWQSYVQHRAKIATLLVNWGLRHCSRRLKSGSA